MVKVLCITIVIASALLSSQFVWSATASPFTYILSHAESGDYCLDIRGGKGKPGAKVQLYKCHGGDLKKLNQRWEYTGDGHLIGYGNLCLDASSSKAKPGAQLTIEKCKNSPYQYWKLETKTPYAQHESARIVGMNNLCAAVAKVTSRNNTPVILASCRQSKLVGWRSHRIESTDSVACAKAVQKLINKHLKPHVPINDYDVPKACAEKQNNVYQTFKGYLSRGLQDLEQRIYNNARKDLDKHR